MAGKLKFNFWRDLTDEIKARLDKMKYLIPSDLDLTDGKTKSLPDYARAEKLFKHYCSVVARRIPILSYKVHISDFIKLDSAKNKQCELFNIAFSCGKDVNSLITNKAKKVRQFKQENLDHMLSEWGIYHFHFDEGRTADLLFVYINENSAYFLDVLPHGHDLDDVDVWCNKYLVEVMHLNWPEVIKRFVYVNRADVELIPDCSISRKNARGENANSFVYMTDGTTYLPIGGGFAADGASIKIMRCVTQMMSNIKEAGLDVVDACESIRRQLNLLESDDLKLKMLFDDDMELCIYNKKRNVRLKLCRV